MHRNYRKLLRKQLSLGKKAKNWIKAGAPLPPAQVVKITHLKSLVQKHGLTQFVETGSFYGDSLEFIARLGVKCWTIELSDFHHEFCKERFKSFSNVNLVKGDSGVELPKLIKDFDVPTFFWLDGHYSASNTAKGDKFTPVSEEVNAILEHPVKNHVILIDDARLFDGTEDYPHLGDFLTILKDYPHYKFSVECDAIRIEPKD